MVIDTKDVPYDMGTGEGSAEMVFDHDNWHKVTVQAVQDDGDCAAAGHTGHCKNETCSCPCHAGCRLP